jgi:NAD(P)-dependent dehydrogenase (short-subunit alcohol dehydrogenase family)
VGPGGIGVGRAGAARRGVGTVAGRVEEETRIVDLELDGTRALVTGSTGGIGAAIAEQLAVEGARVVVHGRDAGRAEEVAGRVRAAGGTADVVLGDLTDPAATDGVVAAVEAALGGIDVLVNNVGGVDGLAGWMDTSPEAWASAYAQNVLPAVRLAQAFAPGMCARGWGRIIQVASGVATQPDPVGADYAAAKAALVNMTVSLSKALAGTGVTANTVAPGPVRTARMEAAVRSVAEDRGWGTEPDELVRHAEQDLWPNPTGRVGRVDEVAAAVAFLAGRRSGYVNGADLRVDGGTTVTTN